jgi:hypothetical protein
MSASLSGVSNWQEFSDLGLLAAGFRLYTYLPGTTTHANVFTDVAASIPHTYTSDGVGGQYIALNSRGEVPGNIYFPSGGIDLTLKTSLGSTVWTKRAIGQADGATALDTAVRADLANASDAAKSDALIGVKRTFTGGQATTQHEVNERTFNVFDGLTAVQRADVLSRAFAQDCTSAIQAVIDAAHAAGGGVVLFPSGSYKTTSPLKTYGGVELRGEGGDFTIIKKTTNTVGSGTSRARSAAVTDSYAVDSIISIWHDDTASGTLYAYRAHIRGIQLLGIGNTYGLYAPRVSQTVFEDLYILNAVIGIRTYDGWMLHYNRCTMQAVQWGFQHANDTTGQGSGTSAHFDDCWVNFDNTLKAPVIGFDLDGLTYSTLTSCGVDNCTRLDATVPFCYSFATCRGISVIACGAESSVASIINAGSSRVMFSNFRSFGMSGNAGWGTVGGIFNDASSLTFIGCDFAVYSSPGPLFNQIIQNAANQTEIDSAMPSGGNTFIGYGTGSQRTTINGGKVRTINSTGTRDTFGNISTLTYSASMTPDCDLGNEFVITATNNTAFAINAPASSPGTGQRITVTIRNASGGALGAVTWNAVFKMSAWTQPANGFSRSIDFIYNGTNWVQAGQTGVDVPN